MQSLEEYVNNEGPLPVRDALGWVLRAGLTAWELHADGLAHGRISPVAIMLEEPDCRGRGRLLAPSEVAEDPAYHSLARGEGGGPSLQDDVWALGVILYFALTGALPYPNGVAASVEGDRLRPPRPLAVHRAELDVMQPVVDRLIRIDMPHIATNVEDLVFGLRDFSPTIADLDGLEFDRPSAVHVPSEDEQPEQKRSAALRSQPPPAPRAAASSEISRNALVGALAALAAMVAIFLWMTKDNAPLLDASPDGANETAPTLPVPTPPVTATTVATSNPAPSASVAIAVAPKPTPQPAVSAKPTDGGDLVACTTAMFASDVFGKQRVAVDFPCDVRDGKKGAIRLTAQLSRGSGGKATKGTKEWSALGWYQIATYSVLRARCCKGVEPVTTPALLSTCQIDEALEQLTVSAISRSDDQLAAGIDAYRSAIHCAMVAGGSAYFGQTRPPTTGQAAIFLRMLARLRAATR